jgi:PmbA protein
MIRELYQQTLREISLNVTSGEIDSLRKKNITKSGCRVYDSGYLGIAGILGQPDEKTWAQAKANLTRKIPCPWGAETGKQRKVSYGGQMEPEAFLAEVEKLLAALLQAYPQFIFSNKLNWVTEETSLRNDMGLDYFCQNSYAEVGILVRAQESANIFDTVIGGTYQNFVAENVLKEASEILEAHLHPISLPEGEKAAVIAGIDLFDRAWSEGLHTQKLARNASPFSGKLGKQLFSQDFTLQVNRSNTSDYKFPFFDAEGTTLEGDAISLIENGVLLRGYSDKKSAEEHGVALTASAAGNYDDVPSLSAAALDVKPTGKTIDEILNGRPALYIMPSGGDVTPDGSFATPVQIAYLYQNGHFLGRLPEFSLRGNLYELFGKDYLGCAQFVPSVGSRCVLEMTIVR